MNTKQIRQQIKDSFVEPADQKLKRNMVHCECCDRVFKQQHPKQFLCWSCFVEDRRPQKGGD